MQIILSKNECEIIYESMLTEITEQTVQNKLDDRRGRSVEYGTKRFNELEELIKRFKPYVQ